jgi:predicted nucleotidyltransferase
MKQLTEVPAIGAAARALLVQAREAVRAVEPGAAVILYGSRARGDAAPDSDWDLLVLLDGPVDWRREEAVRRPLIWLGIDSDAVLTVLVYSRQDWQSALYQAMPLHQSVSREGVAL